MSTLAVDPGAKFTGVAILHDSGKFFAQQIADPRGAFEWIESLYLPGDTLLVEDYTHGGIFTREAKDTLKVIGLFEYGFAAWNPIIRNKSMRLSGVAQATDMVREKYPDLSAKQTKDAISALAHAIVFRRGK